MSFNKLALSFDVEDWFCVENMREIYPFQTWKKCELRVHDSTRYILKQLDKRNLRATFFVLGWVAERLPELIQEISNAGHEIASHGYSHLPATLMTPGQFEKDLEKSLEIIAPLANNPILGFRAPSFSVTEKTLWVLKVLADKGIRYDSSIYPARHPNYGISGFGQRIQEIDGIIEIPMNSFLLGKFEIPISGGGYFRMFPYGLFKLLMKTNMKKRHSITYFHPWEFDHSQPRINLPAIKSFRHYVGLGANKGKFERFLDDFEFTSILDYLYISGKYDLSSPSD